MPVQQKIKLPSPYTFFEISFSTLNVYITFET